MPERDGATDLGQWQVETLRATVFPTTPPPVGKQTWWSELVGAPVETQVSKPAAGVQQEEGRFHESKLVLTLQPNRIEWLLQAWIEEITPGFDLVGPVTEVLPPFQDLVRAWFQLPSSPPLQRLAFGAVLLRPVETRQEGYRVLAGYLPNVSLAAEEISDFSFQINRPRVSKCGPTNLRLNRLTRWSVATMQRLELSSFGRSAPPAILQTAARLELDMNTAADFPTPLDPQHLVPLFDELVDLGVEIAREGDQP